MSDFKDVRMNKKYGLLALGFSLLLGCGGGGSGGNAAPPPVSEQPSGINWQPTAAADWPVSTATAEGLNSTLLDQAYQAGRTENGLYAVLVAKRGLLVGEAYYNDKKASDLLHLRSVTKTLVSTLIGIAIAERKIQSLDQPINDFLRADYGSLLNNKTDITIRHLLTMSSGISWDESQLSGYTDWESSSDPTRYVLERGLLTTPGLQFNYNSGASHLLSVILTKATGVSTESYARTKLFTPLGIANWNWPKLRDGFTNGAAGLQLTARDLTKLAVLWQQQGRWQQQQLVSASYLLTAAESQRNLRASVGGLNLTGYGFLWWLGSDNGRALQLAWGYGGQFALTLPAQDTTILVMGYNVPSNVRDQERRLMELVVQKILPAIPQ
ncbi:class C beta-lactamase-related serine hydrolase [Rheinheimera riviphila]|uniref:Class C beta-lactamase-related serine hydrolase n=2 Tax=Rheinheimera riviphila TaxID=1834037 RepID=A0A437QFE4_9GAMM|nr:class C beta-lactamase-related serine hydrolase [Rheinheimera riviphila]